MAFWHSSRISASALVVSSGGISPSITRWFGVMLTLTPGGELVNVRNWLSFLKAGLPIVRYAGPALTAGVLSCHHSRAAGGRATAEPASRRPLGKKLRYLRTLFALQRIIGREISSATCSARGGPRRDLPGIPALAFLSSRSGPGGVGMASFLH